MTKIIRRRWSSCLKFLALLQSRHTVVDLWLVFTVYNKIITKRVFTKKALLIAHRPKTTWDQTPAVPFKNYIRSHGADIELRKLDFTIKVLEIAEMYNNFYLKEGSTQLGLEVASKQSGQYIIQWILYVK